MTASVMPLTDANGTVHNVDVEAFALGPDGVNPAERARVIVSGFIGDGTEDISPIKTEILPDGTSVLQAAMPIADVTRSYQNELLPSAARTATETTDPATNSGLGSGAGSNIPMAGQEGVMLALNVTANPGGGQTLSLKVQAAYIEAPTTEFVDYCDFGVLFTAANGTILAMLYPGALAADAATPLKVKSLPCPRVYRAIVTHSGGGSWTYSLNAMPLPR
jgi:hypothetical protein